MSRASKINLYKENTGSPDDEFTLELNGGAVTTVSDQPFKIRQPLSLKLDAATELDDVAQMLNNANLQIQNLNVTINNLENSLNGATLNINNLIIQNNNLQQNLTALETQVQNIVAGIDFQNIIQSLFDNGQINLNNITVGQTVKVVSNVIT